MSRLVFVEWLFVLAVTVLLCAGVSSGGSAIGLTAKFSFELSRTGAEPDESMGTIVLNSDSTLTVLVDSPRSQWMLFGEENLVIFYPGSQSGICIPTIVGRTTLPIFELALNAMKDDFGLSALGYELIDSQADGDSLTFVWQAPAALSRSGLGRIYAKYAEDKLCGVVTVSKNGDTVSVQNYGDYVVNSGIAMPTRVSTVAISATDTTTQRLRLWDVVFGSDLSKVITRDSIPEEATIDTVKW